MNRPGPRPTHTARRADANLRRHAPGRPRSSPSPSPSRPAARAPRPRSRRAPTSTPTRSRCSRARRSSSATLDARAMFAAGDVGAQVAALADRLVPVGDDAGFVAKRDVDRVVMGVYTTHRGRRRRRRQRPLRRGEDRRLDDEPRRGADHARPGTPAARRTPSAPSCTPSCPRRPWSPVRATACAASSSACRRHPPSAPCPRGRSRRSPPRARSSRSRPTSRRSPSRRPPWARLSLPWMNGMRTAKVIGNFETPGMNVAATLTYGDPQQAAGRGGRGPPRRRMAQGARAPSSAASRSRTST